MKDKLFLQWIHDRIIHVYGESKSVDYLHKLRAIIKTIPDDQLTPNVVSPNKPIGMYLSATNVANIFNRCLFVKPGPANDLTLIEGVMANVYFYPDCLNKAKEDIISMLNQLPKEFKSTDGESFLYMCLRKDKEQWGARADSDQLVCLGIAIGAIKFPFPRETWPTLPGSMPYLTINTDINETTKH